MKERQKTLIADLAWGVTVSRQTKRAVAHAHRKETSFMIIEALTPEIACKMVDLQVELLRKRCLDGGISEKEIAAILPH